MHIQQLEQITIFYLVCKVIYFLNVPNCNITYTITIIYLLTYLSKV